MKYLNLHNQVAIYWIVKKDVATCRKSRNFYHLNCTQKRMTTNAVTTSENEDTKEAILH